MPQRWNGRDRSRRRGSRVAARGRGADRGRARTANPSDRVCSSAAPRCRCLFPREYQQRAAHRARALREPDRVGRVLGSDERSHATARWSRCGVVDVRAVRFASDCLSDGAGTHLVRPLVVWWSRWNCGRAGRFRWSWVRQPDLAAGTPRRSAALWMDDPRARFFSGTASYRQTSQLPPAFRASGSRVFLDFGEGRAVEREALPGGTMRGNSFAALIAPPIREAARFS